MAGGAPGRRLTMTIYRNNMLVDPPDGTFVYTEVGSGGLEDLVCDPNVLEEGDDVTFIPHNVLLEFSRVNPLDPDIQLACMLRGIYLYIADTTEVASTTVAAYNATVL